MDLVDVDAMLSRGLITTVQLRDALKEVLAGLARYPAVDQESLVRRVLEFLNDWDRRHDP